MSPIAVSDPQDLGDAPMLVAYCPLFQAPSRLFRIAQGCSCPRMVFSTLLPHSKTFTTLLDFAASARMTPPAAPTCRWCRLSGPQGCLRVARPLLLRQFPPG